MEGTPMHEKLLREFADELKKGLAHGCQVVPKRDGSEERIRYEAMDYKTKVLFLTACVDFTDYVNRGMEPAIGDRILDNVIAGKPSERWLDGILGPEGELIGTTSSAVTTTEEALETMGHELER
jgi:hypothetical protein